MDRDIRQSAFYRTAERFFLRWMEPGFGRVTAAEEPAPRPGGRAVAVTGTVFDELLGQGHTRIAIADGQGMRVVTGGPGHDRCPQWSPDGTSLAFLSDRAEQGVFRLYLLREGLPEASTTPAVDGTAEYCLWSPDGRHVLLGVAGRGADLAGVQGSGTTTAGSTTAGTADLPAWMPEVSEEIGENAWRGCWLYSVADHSVRRVSPPGLNVWEATWLGPGRVAAIVSPGDPREKAWYTACLAIFDIAEGAESVVYPPKAQLGRPAGSPAGTRLAVIEAACSDRGLVAGDIRVIDLATGAVRGIHTGNVDVSALQWIDERHLGYAGARGLETVVGRLDVDAGTNTELLRTDATSGQRQPEAAFAPDGTAALVLESYDRPPVIALVSSAEVSELASLAHPGTDWLRSVAGTAEPLRWRAPDGLEIEGIVCRPPGAAPFPLVVLIHGGPVASFRSRWCMGYDFTPLLVSRGYAVLHPNPRGSSGRGQSFARAVFGDTGGADADDIGAGVEALVRAGLADPDRIGVTGRSYGGFMSCWLATGSMRPAAAVAIAPVTDWYSKHYSSNIGTSYLGDDPYRPAGRHFDRSPVMRAPQARTPTLLIAGALDRCTPLGQAVEFHNALREHGVETALAVYPHEGHGVRNFPARIDVAARMLAWFERQLPADAR